MKLLSFLKRIFLLSPNGSDEEKRNELELANMPIEQEEFIEKTIVSNNVDEELLCDDTKEETTKELEDIIVSIDTEGPIKPIEQQQGKIKIIPNPKNEIESVDGLGVSLLDNSNYMSIVGTVSSLMDEIEDVDGLSTEELVEIVKSRLQEGFLISGAELISEDKEFNAIRHIPVPAAMVKAGTPIEKIIEPGIVVGNRVIRKAKVIIQK